MKMKYYFYIVFPLLISLLIFAGCSELEPGISQPQALSVHKPGILTPGHANFHGTLVKENGWSMKECQSCHAADFSGGVAGATCLNCHSGDRGPESCNTCHGSFSNPSRIAPPRDLEDNFLTDSLGVGFHTKHLYENSLGSSARCGSCHQYPGSGIYAEGHLGTDNRAEVILKGIATAFGADDAVYNPEDGSCSNTYCHGNFEFLRDSAKAENRFAYTADRMTGIKNTVKWNQLTGNETQCGTCHGLPPAGHIQVPLSSCYTCHPGVVDEQGNILDKSLHINGMINARN